MVQNIFFTNTTIREEILLASFLFLIIWCIFIYPKYKREPVNLLTMTFLYVYCVGILYITLFPLDASSVFLNFEDGLNKVNLVPFSDVILSHDGAIKELVLNITLFVPLGILWSYIKDDFSVVLQKAVLFSFSIEITQALLTCFAVGNRTCDITDFIANVLGACVGYFIFYAVFKSSKQILNKNEI